MIVTITVLPVDIYILAPLLLIKDSICLRNIITFEFQFQYGDKYSSRLADRLVNPEQIKALLTLQATLPGVPFNYYGNEIGMTDHPTLSPPNKYRTPMQWNSKGTGFSQNTPWVDRNANYITVNVEVKGRFIIRLFKDLIYYFLILM